MKTIQEKFNFSILSVSLVFLIKKQSLLFLKLNILNIIPEYSHSKILLHFDPCIVFITFTFFPLFSVFHIYLDNSQSSHQLGLRQYMQEDFATWIPELYVMANHVTLRTAPGKLILFYLNAKILRKRQSGSGTAHMENCFGINWVSRSVQTLRNSFVCQVSFWDATISKISAKKKIFFGGL